MCEYTSTCIEYEGQQDIVKSDHGEMFHCFPFCISAFGKGYVLSI